LKDKWAVCLREGGSSLVQNGSTEPGRMEVNQGKFESSLEDFHSTLDQTLINLKCANDTAQQAQSSSRYIPGNLSYHQNVSTARTQIQFTGRVKDLLRTAAQGIVDHSLTTQ